MDGDRFCSKTAECSLSIFLIQNRFFIQDNNLERAVDWIFNHPDEVIEVEIDQSSSAAEPQYVDGPGSM